LPGGHSIGQGGPKKKIMRKIQGRVEINLCPCIKEMVAVEIFKHEKKEARRRAIPRLKNWKMNLGRKSK